MIVNISFARAKPNKHNRCTVRKPGTGFYSKQDRAEILCFRFHEVWSKNKKDRSVAALAELRSSVASMTFFFFYFSSPDLHPHTTRFPGHLYKMDIHFSEVVHTKITFFFFFFFIFSRDVQTEAILITLKRTLVFVFVFY